LLSLAQNQPFEIWSELCQAASEWNRPYDQMHTEALTVPDEETNQQ
jgi:hypothetical protein